MSQNVLSDFSAFLPLPLRVKAEKPTAAVRVARLAPGDSQQF